MNNISIDIDLVSKIARLMKSDKSRALLVGGCVRDEIMGLVPKDFDMEVYGLNPDELLSRLTSAGLEIDAVGKAFGVIKIKDAHIDISIPRHENKAGLGHKGFEILSDPFLTPKEAAYRRDFTINALAKDPLTGEIFDFYGGRDDLKNGVLRPTSEKFKEDPLRILRAMQFIARFDLDPHSQLLAYAKEMTMEGLSRERIYEEFCKLILKGKNIKKGLDFLKDSSWIRFFPELSAMVETPQDPKWHPEGDVFTHTGYCMNEFAKLRGDNDTDNLILGFSVLLHDIAKPETTAFIDGHWRALGHEDLARGPIGTFLRSLTDQETLVESVTRLACSHMTPTQLYKSEAKESAVRRLAVRVGRLDLLAKVVICDKRGRPPIVADEIPEVDWLLDIAKRLEITSNKPKPIILGRHLLALGMVPSPRMGQILSVIFEAQLEGEINNLEEGIVLAKKLINA